MLNLPFGGELSLCHFTSGNRCLPARFALIYREAGSVCLLESRDSGSGRDRAVTMFMPVAVESITVPRLVAGDTRPVVRRQ